jgi:CRISPR-associated protein Csm3
MKKTNHLVIKGTIELLSGTRVGGSDDVLQIGGTDLTCIKDPVTGRPYIPGSSIKGKMRSCLERELDRTNGGEPCGCAGERCPICRVFGPHKNAKHQLGPTRIIIRDAPLLSQSYTIENKTESTNRRDTGTAHNPRTVERVAPGAKFAFEIAVQVFDLDEKFRYEDKDGNDVFGEKALLQVVYHALDLVEDTGIGSGVGKGYGQIRIENEQAVTPIRRDRFKGTMTAQNTSESSQ